MWYVRIAVKWGHIHEILKMLLEADPSQDPRALFMLKLGPVASIYFWLVSRVRQFETVGVENRAGENNGNINGDTHANNMNSAANPQRFSRFESVKEEDNITEEHLEEDKQAVEYQDQDMPAKESIDEGHEQNHIVSEDCGDIPLTADCNSAALAELPKAMEDARGAP